MRIGLSDAQFLMGRMLSVLNTDGDAGISAEEIAKLGRTKAAAASGADVQAYLAQQDADGDGRLNLKEIAPSEMFSAELLHTMLDEASGSFLRVHRLEVADAALVQGVRAQALAELDVDGDGGLSADELAALRAGPADDGRTAAVIEAFDHDGDGRLNFLELSRSGLVDAAGLAAKTFARGDTDADGALSAAEYAALRADDGSSDGTAFERADQDGDGALTEAELADQLRGLGPVIIPLRNLAAAKGSMLGGADADGDGAFSQAELAGLTNAQDAGAMLAGFDADKDGKLSTAEIDAAMADRPEFYRSGLMRVEWDGQFGRLIGPTAAETALSRALTRSIDRMMDEFTGRIGSTADRKA